MVLLKIVNSSKSRQTLEVKFSKMLNNQKLMAIAMINYFLMLEIEYL